MDIIDDFTEKKETTTVFDTTCHYIVVDTNVLISELHLITELKDKSLDGFGPPHFFIPWVVIEELDKLKRQRRDSNAACRAAACDAIRYLNSVLRYHPRFHGQTPAEAEEWAKTYTKCNDDKILECCVALMNKMPPEKVILLTNDKNLVNKALICKINVHDSKSIIKKEKPDTVFNCEEAKTRKRKREESSSEDIQEIQRVSPGVAEERLTSKRDSCKYEIHAIMSDVRLLLVNTLFQFFSEGMNEAYGDSWLKFESETKLLKGRLDVIKRYWLAVFPQFLSEKDKRNFELLLEKATRPEGFIGDKDECLVILSAIEDVFSTFVFRQLQRRRPKLKLPIKEIEHYRVACVNAFISLSEAESCIRVVEERSLREILDRTWNVINQLCGIILDHYGVPHDFGYNKLDQPLPETEIRRIMADIHPGVQTLRNLFISVYAAIQNSEPVKSLTQKLATALLNFIPSLKLTRDPLSYPFFSGKSLEFFFTCPQNRETLKVGIDRIDKFSSKLGEALNVILQQSIRKSSEEPESMICD